MLKDQTILSVLWFVLAFAIIWLFSVQIITMNHYVLVIVFQVIASLIIGAYFREELHTLVKNTRWSEALGLLIISLLTHAAASYYIVHYVQQPVWSFSSEGASFLLMNGYYIWTKPVDVFSQQLLIVLLVGRLHNLGVSMRRITQLFLVCFGAIHIFQTFKTHVSIGLLFTVGAVLFSFIFPRMILKVRNGYIYNYMIHLGLYNVAALFFWLFY